MDLEDDSIQAEKAQNATEPNVIRIKSSGQMNAYIERAERLLKSGAYTHVRLKASSTAIPKAVSIAEILKRILPHVHQIASLSLDQTPDKLRRTPPLRNQSSGGESRVERDRIVSSLTILLRLPDPVPESSSGQKLSV